jgi:hypothetical protein
MLPLAAKSSYAENDQAMDIAKGVLAGALKVDFTRSFYDTTQCAKFTELVAATDPHPYVIHTRMEATRDGKASKIESVVTDAGDWVFGATEHLATTRSEKWDEIPKDKRDTREAIQAAADAYLNNWGDPTLPVPHGTPCSRLEGRTSTAARNPEGQTCTMGAFPQKLKVTNRRYVIDETIGAVSIFHNFPRPARRFGLRAARIATSTRSRSARRQTVGEAADQGEDREGSEDRGDPPPQHRQHRGPTNSPCRRGIIATDYTDFTD